MDKLERKAKAAEILQDVRPLRDDLYLPVDPHARVLSVIPSSATPMQSAAKVRSARITPSDLVSLFKTGHQGS